MRKLRAVSDAGMRKLYWQMRKKSERVRKKEDLM